MEPKLNCCRGNFPQPESTCKRFDHVSIEKSSKFTALSAKMRQGDFRLYAFFLLACVPVLFALRIQLKHWVDIPIWDEWDTPGAVLMRLAEHQLSWADLFAQHNESRKVFPRLVYIALASAFGWDVRHGMILTFLSAAIASAFVLRYLRAELRVLDREVLLPWILVNLLLFAPSQYENLLSGFAFEFFIPVLCLLGCIAVNLSQRRLPEKVAWNSILAVVATYTFAHGMLLWPLAVPIPRDDERSRRNWIRRAAPWYLVFVLIATVSIVYYFIGYRRPDVAPPEAKLSQIGQILAFMVVWLGAPVRSPALNADVAGTTVGLLLVAAIAVSMVFLYRNRAAWKNDYPWLMLAAFSLASGFLTAIGRVNLGVDLVFNTSFDGFSSIRYNATSVFAYVATIGLLSRLYRNRFKSSRNWRGPYLACMTVFTTLLCVAWIYLLSSEWTRLDRFQENRRRARTAVIWSKALPDNPDIFFAYPYPEQFPQRVETMRHLGLLRIPGLSEELTQAIFQIPRGSNFEAGNLDRGTLRGDEQFRIEGWGRNPEQNAPADYVVLGWDEEANSFHPFIALSTGGSREDVADAFKSPSIRNAGFDHEINVSKLPRRPLVLRAWSIDMARQQAFPMNGSVRLERPVLHSP